MVRRAASNGARASCAAANSMPPLIEVRSANDRGSSSNWSPKRRARRRAVDQGPIDHDLLRAEAGPFDEANRNPLVRTGTDRFEHLRVGDCRRIALSLQQEFRMIDAARNIGGEHQQQVDPLGRRHPYRLPSISAVSANIDRMSRVMTSSSGIAAATVARQFCRSGRSAASLADFRRRRESARVPLTGMSAAASAHVLPTAERAPCRALNRRDCVDQALASRRGFADALHAASSRMMR